MDPARHLSAEFLHDPVRAVPIAGQRGIHRYHQFIVHAHGVPRLPLPGPIINRILPVMIHENHEAGFMAFTNLFIRGARNMQSWVKAKQSLFRHPDQKILGDCHVDQTRSD
jgi:hypothetical protein